MRPSRVGEQLELALLDERLKRVPWNGRSPRDLTRGAELFIFQQRAEKSVRDFVNDDQGDLFEAPRKRAPADYAGAPLLLPFGRR